MSGRAKRLHTLAHRLGFSDEQYRQTLEDSFGVSSSSQLTDMQAASLAAHWQSMLDGKPNKFGWGREKYNNLYRPDYLATPAQLRMIEGMWSQVCRVRAVEGREATLDEFLYNRFGTAAITLLEKCNVEKVKKALEVMGAEKR